MCAAFGAILYRVEQHLNTVNLVNIPPRVEEILSKNGFLSHYGRVKLPDYWGTTISYQQLDIKDDCYSPAILRMNLLHRFLRR